MMIRPARDADLDPIARIYDEILDLEDARPVSYTNWQRGRYPTRDTARQALEEGTLWVLELSLIHILSSSGISKV